MGSDESETQSTEVIRESRLRSVLKALSWRVLATLTTIAIAYFIVDDVRTALKIGAVEVVAKMLIYYLHERAWAKVPLGMVRCWVGAEKS